MNDRLHNETLRFSTLTLIVSLVAGFIHFQPDVASAAPVRLFANITIQMFKLTSNGSNTGIHCSPGDMDFGCTYIINDPSHSYPYPSWEWTIPIETDYLLDVVAQEMSPELYGEPEALEAQAIVSRSYANYFINNPPELGDPPDDPFNNSAKYQIFIPYRFEKLAPTNYPDNPTFPCNSQNLNENQFRVCFAINSGNYISSAAYGNSLPAKALFHADSVGQTWNGTSDKPYLVGVNEPISQSSICDANNEGERYGFSQEGANRWVRGNMCARDTTGDISWSVRWNRVEQILIHYYTGIHLLNPGSAIMTPVYRWNPLSINWGVSGNQPPIMYHGQSYPITVQVQNTSIYDWPHNGEPWSLSYHWSKIGSSQIDSNNRSWTPINIPMGDPPYNFSITNNDLPNWGKGAYSLQFDMVLSTYGGTYWFSRINSGSQNNWPTYNVNICVDGTCNSFLPTVMK